MNIQVLTEYTVDMANRVRELLIQLSRSGRDRGEIPEEWFRGLIESPYHDMLVAYDEDGKIVGIATVSVIMGPIVRKVAYLEDFVTDTSVRGRGVGSQMWEAIVTWAREHGCTELNFTSGKGREAAQEFYRKRGAEVYDTNFFRLGL
ncbi:GNAT family N-acetyltransferase [Candidatus Saccharibacteria bacterium]|nr:GNAT family N-acetyltransferase [Candidatus Saccharibacteria bacterium]